MTDMKKFNPLFTFLEVYKKMDYDEKIFCQKMLETFNDFTPIKLVQETFVSAISQPTHQKKTKQNNKTAPGFGVQSQCDTCGSSFVKTCNNNKYCSLACKQAAVKKKGVRKHIKGECVICGSTFYTKNKGIRTCSLPCRGKLIKQKQNKNKIVTESPIVRKSNDPYFKPKFIFDQN